MPARKPRDIEAEIDASLRRCNLRCSGLWCKMRYQIEHICDGQPGELRLHGQALDAEQIGTIAGSSADKVQPLLDTLVKVGLITIASGVIASPHLTRINEIRAQQRERVRAFRKKGSGRALRNAKRALRTPDVTQCNAPVTPGVSPPSVSPPITPSSNPPLPEDSVPTEPGEAAAPPSPARKIALQNRVMEEVWKPKWAAIHHGEDYSPGRVDYTKLAEILSRLKRSSRDEAHTIERFGKVADTALAVPEEFGWQGHRLPVMEKNLQWLISETAAREKGIVNGNGRSNNRSSTARGEFKSDLPARSREL